MIVRKHPVFLYMLSYDLFLKILECLDENITSYYMYKASQHSTINALCPSSQLFQKLATVLKVT